MSEKETKKPFYKRWWFWLIVVVVLIAMIVPEDEEEVAEDTEEKTEETNQEVEDNESNESNEEAEENNEDKEDVKETPEEKKTINVNEEIELGNINIDIENAYVENNVLSFGFWWNHWASNEKIHFSVLAYPVVSQNGNELEMQDDKDTLLKQTAKGVDSRVDLKYELEDDSPVEIKFKTTSDDPEEESITIDID